MNTGKIKVGAHPQTQHSNVWVRKVCWSYPELLDQVHIGSLILLHAALRDTGHVSSQCAVNQHTQHVQHCCEELAVGEKRT